MVIDVINGEKRFDNINVGDVFNYKGDYFIKISDMKCSNSVHNWNAFNVTENRMTGFEDWVMTTPMSAVLNMRVYDEYIQLIEQSKEDTVGLIYIGKDIAGSPHLTTAEKWELQLIIRNYRGI